MNLLIICSHYNFQSNKTRWKNFIRKCSFLFRIEILCGYKSSIHKLIFKYCKTFWNNLYFYNFENRLQSGFFSKWLDFQLNSNIFAYSYLKRVTVILIFLNISTMKRLFERFFIYYDGHMFLCLQRKFVFPIIYSRYYIVKVIWKFKNLSYLCKYSS